MDVLELEIAERLGRILMPYAMEKRQRVQDNKIRFVHYTNADSALRIFTERRILMRNTICMNDCREVEHGLEHLIGFFTVGSKTRAVFFEAVNLCGDNLAEEAVDLFDKWLPHNRYNVYVTCISEHANDEDAYGRLSMWRAYGRGSIGVAIIMRNEPFWQHSHALKAYASPIAYSRNQDFNTEMLRVVSNIRENCAFLKTVPRPTQVGFLFNTLMCAAACTKHPGFAEEREWRLVHLPKTGEFAFLEKSIQTIGGVPQTIYKVPLKDIPEEGLIGIEPQSLFDRIIIGPSTYPWPLYEAFVSVLKEAGVKDAEERVVCSDIPVRSW